MQPIYTPAADGEAYDLNATALLLLSADVAYGEGRHNTPPAGQIRAAKVVTDLLAAATAGGYPQADILESLLARGEVSKRVTAMCGVAMDAAGNDRAARVMAAMRGEHKGGVQ
jgi:hypothetical protein